MVKDSTSSCKTIKVSFKNAFKESLQPHHIQIAKNKCGYAPATWAQLNSDKLHHELFEGQETDPYSLLLNELEKQNEEAVQFLLDKGYKLAHKLRCNIKTVTREQQEAQKVSNCSKYRRSMWNAYESNNSRWMVLCYWWWCCFDLWQCNSWIGNKRCEERKGKLQKVKAPLTVPSL